MKDKIRLEVMKVFNQDADVDTVVYNILLLFGVSDLICPSCGAETIYNNDLGLYKCNECEWEGQKNH